MNKFQKFPFYAKLTFILLSIISLFVILYIGQGIIIPLFLALLFAIILQPLALFLEKKVKLSQLFAVAVTTTLFLVFIFGLLIFLSFEIKDMTNNWDKIFQNISFHFKKLQEVIALNFNINQTKQEEIFNDLVNDSVATSKKIIGNTLLSFTDTILNLTLIPIYTFLFLLYKNHFIQFFSKLFPENNHEKVQNILSQIKIAIQSYIVGLLSEMIIVATLTSIGFSIIGIQYALVLGVLTGLLNLIPYVGILFAGFLSIVATLSSSADISIILSVISVIVVVQIIDNNILVPLIVSSKVQINALFSIIGIIIGSAVSGVSGMFLAIPTLAILKVIFDRIEKLEAFGYLIGNDIPKKFNWKKNNTSNNEENTQI